MTRTLSCWQIMRTTFLLSGLVLTSGVTATRATGAPAGARLQPRAVLVGIVLSSGQALVWDGQTRRYRLLERGYRFRGARVLDLGVDRILVEQGGVKHVWALRAPLLRHPAQVSDRQARRRPGLIVTPWARRPPGRRARPGSHRGARTGLPPAPVARDEPPERVRRRVWLPYRALAWLAEDLVRAEQEIRLARDSDRAVRVVFVRGRGRLAPLGLRAGDRIEGIDGQPVGGVEQAAVLFSSLRPGRVLRLVLRRGRKRIALSVVLR